MSKKKKYIIIFNKKIKKQLSTTSENLNIREDLKKGVYVEGLSEEIVNSSQETLNLLKKGARNRHVGST